MAKTLYCIIVMLLSYVSCVSQSIIKEGTHSYAYISSGIGNIIPAHYDSICIKLNLPKITSSPDSFMLRLWTSSMIGYGVIVLKNNNGKWEVHWYKYLSPSTLKEKPFKSNISIEPLLASLRQINFKSLKNQMQIPNFKGEVYDGTTYELEVIYKDSLNIVSYHSPESYTDPDNRKFTSILNLLDRYLNIYQ